MHHYSFTVVFLLHLTVNSITTNQPIQLRNLPISEVNKQPSNDERLSMGASIAGDNCSISAFSLRKVPSLSTIFWFSTATFQNQQILWKDFINCLDWLIYRLGSGSNLIPKYQLLCKQSLCNFFPHRKCGGRDKGQCFETFYQILAFLHSCLSCSYNAISIELILSVLFPKIMGACKCFLLNYDYRYLLDNIILRNEQGNKHKSNVRHSSTIQRR